MLIFDCKLICEEKSCGLPQLKEETQNIMIVSFLWCFFFSVFQIIYWVKRYPLNRCSIFIFLNSKRSTYKLKFHDASRGDKVDVRKLPFKMDRLKKIKQSTILVSQFESVLLYSTVKICHRHIVLHIKSDVWMYG